MCPAPPSPHLVVKSTAQRTSTTVVVNPRGKKWIPFSVGYLLLLNGIWTRKLKTSRFFSQGDFSEIPVFQKRCNFSRSIKLKFAWFSTLFLRFVYAATLGLIKSKIVQHWAQGVLKTRSMLFSFDQENLLFEKRFVKIILKSEPYIYTRQVSLHASRTFERWCQGSSFSESPTWLYFCSSVRMQKFVVKHKSTMMAAKCEQLSRKITVAHHTIERAPPQHCRTLRTVIWMQFHASIAIGHTYGMMADTRV